MSTSTSKLFDHLPKEIFLDTIIDTNNDDLHHITVCLSLPGESASKEAKLLTTLPQMILIVIIIIIIIIIVSIIYVRLHARIYIYHMQVHLQLHERIGMYMYMH